MDEILLTIRQLLIDHLAPMEALTADLPLGGTVVTIGNTSRYRVGDTVLLMSNQVGQAESNVIQDIPDDKTIILTTPDVRGWTVAEQSLIQKTVNGEQIKGIYAGDLQIIPSYPTITIDIQDESNEWSTLRQTMHTYNFSIRIYVLADNFETTNIFLAKLAKQVREILLDHIRPIIDGVSHPLTADVPAGSTVINVADTSGFMIGGPVFLKDNHPNPASQESYVRSIISPTALELTLPTDFDYLMSRQAEIIFVRRLLYDSRPESISYNYAPGKGATLMRVAEVTWFAKEMILREGNYIT